jgi:hypothetical protein
VPNHLITEVRVDKNGVPVTRHVKPLASSANKAAPPVPAVPDAVRESREYAMQVIMEHSMGFGSGLMEEVLESFSDDTMVLIAGAVGEDDDQVFPEEAAALIGYSGNETEIREYMAFSPGLRDDDDFESTLDYIHGLHTYPKLSRIEDLALTDEDTRKSCHTLLKAAVLFHEDEERGHPAAGKTFIEKRGREFPVVGNQQLVSLILKHPDRGDDILRFIAERGFRTVTALREMLSDDIHTAVMDGFI